MNSTPRFIRADQVSELSNLWHTSRIAVAGAKDRSKYARMLWTSAAFNKAHPEISSTMAYKALCDMLGR